MIKRIEESATKFQCTFCSKKFDDEPTAIKHKSCHLLIDGFQVNSYIPRGIYSTESVMVIEVDHTTLRILVQRGDKTRFWMDGTIMVGCDETVEELKRQQEKIWNDPFRTSYM